MRPTEVSHERHNPGDSAEVGFLDYVILSESWLVSQPVPGYDARADCTLDGLVNLTDLSLRAATCLRVS